MDGKEYSLDWPIVTIGRSADNRIQVCDVAVWPYHAVIHRDGEVCFLENISPVGTWVNRQWMDGYCRLQPGGWIQMGRTVMVFENGHRTALAPGAEDQPGWPVWLPSRSQAGFEPIRPSGERSAGQPARAALGYPAWPSSLMPVLRPPVRHVHAESGLQKLASQGGLVISAVAIGMFVSVVVMPAVVGLLGAALGAGGLPVLAVLAVLAVALAAAGHSRRP
jgi:hypothetical protein